jgi:mono/diheme cytochrome c family protein
MYATRSVWSGVYTAAQADRGKKMYQTACADCHGDQLEGDPGNGVPPLAGDFFMVDWENYPLSDLVRHVHFRPNDEADDMDIVTATDLVAFILAANDIPVGGAELPSSRAIQLQIRIDVHKPE